MDWHWNVFSILLFFSGALGLVLSTIVFFKKKRFDGHNFLFLLFLTGSLYAVLYGAEIAQTTLVGKLLWIRIQHAVLPFFPLFGFLFSLQYSGYIRKFGNVFTVLLFIVPCLTLIISQTNESHNLMYSNPTILQGEFFYYIEYDPGIWYSIQEFFDVIMMIGTLAVFVAMYLKSGAVFNSQLKVMIAALLLPFSAFLLPIIHITPYGLDLIPYAFTITIVLAYIGLFRFSLFDLVPQARELIFDQFQDAIVIIDFKGRILDLNHSFTRIFPYSEKFIGHSCNELCHEWPQLQDFIIRDKSRPKDFHQISEEKGILMMQFSGEVSYFLVRSTPLQNTKRNEILGQIFKFQDITAIKKAEKQIQEQNASLRKINAEKDLLLSIIAHDLRSPFTGLLGMSQILVDELDTMSMDDMRSILSQFSKTSTKLYELVNNLLEWAVLQKDEFRLVKVPTSIRQLIESSINPYKNSIEKKNILLQVGLIPEVILDLDPNAIGSAIRNLIHNAMKFTHPGGRIEIATSYSQDSDYFIIHISDTGIGISEELMARLFSIYEKTGRVGTEGEPTSGLGLPLIQEFIHKHNGKIEVKSEIGKGSEFQLHLPINHKDALRDCDPLP